MSTTVKIGDRIFKECDDVPLAVKEKRKLFWINNGQIFDLRCVSEKYGPRSAIVFFFDNGDMGEQFLSQYRVSGCAYNYKLFFDVTPEKRYAVWNGHVGRFIIDASYGISLSGYRTRGEAETAIQLCEARYHGAPWCGLLKVVEFDNPDAE